MQKISQFNPLSRNFKNGECVKSSNIPVRAGSNVRPGAICFVRITFQLKTRRCYLAVRNIRREVPRPGEGCAKSSARVLVQ